MTSPTSIVLDTLRSNWSRSWLMVSTPSTRKIWNGRRSTACKFYGRNFVLWLFGPFLFWTPAQTVISNWAHINCQQLQLQVHFQFLFLTYPQFWLRCSLAGVFLVECSMKRKISLNICCSMDYWTLVNVNVSISRTNW